MACGLSMVDWESKLSGISVELQYSKLLNNVYSFIDKYVYLLCEVNNSVSWKVNLPREMTRNCKEAWSNYKSIRTLLGRHHLETFAAWIALTVINIDINHDALNSQK